MDLFVKKLLSGGSGGKFGFTYYLVTNSYTISTKKHVYFNPSYSVGASIYTVYKPTNETQYNSGGSDNTWYQYVFKSISGGVGKSGSQIMVTSFLNSTYSYLEDVKINDYVFHRYKLTDNDGYDIYDGSLYLPKGFIQGRSMFFEANEHERTVAYFSNSFNGYYYNPNDGASTYGSIAGTYKIDDIVKGV